MKAERWPTEPPTTMSMPFIEMPQRAPTRAPAPSLLLFARVRGDREEADRELDQVFGAVRRVAVEEQRIARLEAIRRAVVLILHDAFQHVEELAARVLEGGKDGRGLFDGDEIRLDRDALVHRMAQELVLMAVARAAPLDGEPLAGLDEGRIPLRLEGLEKCADRDAERARERLQRRERGRGQPVLDLGQHARGELGALGELSHRQV